MKMENQQKVGIIAYGSKGENEEKNIFLYDIIYTNNLN